MIAISLSSSACEKVLIVASPVSGTEFAASRVVVEKDGVAPPM
jgi:hypothetical protein